jgi:hypothetical protein|tara:strand:+ start:468 stop:575 length:108 start_codon:yes stop_codon:yes gene_type:complete
LKKAKETEESEEAEEAEGYIKTESEDLLFWFFCFF